MRRPAAAYFTQRYAEARARFRDAAAGCGAAIEAAVLPGHAGPDGEDLAVDSAWLGPADASGSKGPGHGFRLVATVPDNSRL